MKCMKFTFLVLLIFTFYANAEIFTLKDGRTVEAEIINYKIDVNIVQLKLSDGKIFNISSEIFIEDDQKNIKNWAINQDFFDNNKFGIDLNQKKYKEKENVEGIDYFSGEILNDAIEIQTQHISYEARIKNNSSLLNGLLIINYCIFYDEEILDRFGKLSTRERYIKANKIIEINDKEEKIFNTVPVKLKRTSYNTFDYVWLNELFIYGYEPNDTIDKIKGIWVKASVPNNKNIILRNFYYPKSLEKKVIWPE